MSAEVVGSELGTKGHCIGQGAAFVRQENAMPATVLGCYCRICNWKSKYVGSQNNLTSTLSFVFLAI
jgi:hypothetical protein